MINGLFKYVCFYILNLKLVKPDAKNVKQPI